MNITGKIALSKLDQVAIVKGKAGQPCLLIDINASHLYLSKENAVYLDVILFESEKKDYGDFAIKQSLPKEVRESDKESQTIRPYLGNASYFERKETGAAEVQSSEVIEESDDLPF